MIGGTAITALDVAALVLRLVAGAIFLAQGVRKCVAPADAPHGRGALETMMQRRGLAAAPLVAGAVGVVELLGGVLLLAGLATRLVAVPLAAVLVTAIAGFKRTDGFIGGWDWPFAVLGLVVSLFVLGPGALSLDHLLGLG